MLDEVIKNQRYSFHEGFDSWQDSIRAACQPLIEEGGHRERLSRVHHRKRQRIRTLHRQSHRISASRMRKKARV